MKNASKIAKRSKNKGNAWERKVYKDLREIDPSVKRSLGSGSSDEPADISLREYAIECKRYKRITLKMICNWMNKLSEEIKGQKGKIPLIVMKEDYKPPQVAFKTKKEPLSIQDYDNWLEELGETS